MYASAATVVNVGVKSQGLCECKCACGEGVCESVCMCESKCECECTGAGVGVCMCVRFDDGGQHRRRGWVRQKMARMVTVNSAPA